MRIRHSALRTPHSARHGFTLIELLVVVGILLVVSLTTVMLVNSTLDSDRGRSGSRTLQSALMGARDRALYTVKSPQGPRNVGLRLIIENPLGADGAPGRINFDDDGNNVPDDRSEVGYPGTDDEFWSTKMAYVEQVTPHTAGTVDLADDPGTTAVEYVWANGTGTNWFDLYRRGLIINGSQIKIPNDATGVTYTVNTQYLAQTPPVERLVLTTPYTAAPSPGLPYRLELEPAIAPNQEPLEMPRNILIDLYRSGLPPTLQSRVDRIDIMFTPRGTLAGPQQSMGFAHFVLRDRDDIENLRSLSAAQREQFGVTIFANSGNIFTAPIDPTDFDNDGRADNPFRFAVEGQVAGQ